MFALIASAALLLAVDAPPASTDNTQTAYQAVRAAAGRTPDDQVRLAYWCEAHGLTAERMRHLAQAVLADPNHAAARGLLGLVARQDRWFRPDVVADQIKADATLAGKLAEYDAKRSSTPYTADGQLALAHWAEANGLAAQAKAHYTAVVRLDPHRDPIWKKLGYKKQNGKWTTDAELAAAKADADAQRAADQKWRPLLVKWKAQLTKPNERADAETQLLTVTDPRAVRQVAAVFLAGSTAYQGIAVRTLAQIDSAASSRLITMLAVLADDPNVRRAAVETLRLRDPRDYADLLIRSLRARLEYEIQRVAGPGSMGRLLIKAPQQNTQRLYQTPAVPNYLTWLTELSNGAPTLNFFYQGSIHREDIKTKSFTYNNFLQYRPTDPRLADFVRQEQANAPAAMQDLLNHNHKAKVFEEHFRKDFPVIYSGFRIESITDSSTPITTETTFPLAAMIAEYQKAAVVAQEQIARDAAILDDYNRQADESNDRVTQVLRAVSGQDIGADIPKWTNWMVGLNGYTAPDQSQPEVPTVTVNVPLAYQPQAVAIGESTFRSGPTVAATHFGANAWYHGRPGPDCFGAGTLVQTIVGPRAIDTLRIGDQVLAQNIATGALNYQPILMVHRTPSSPTFRVRLDAETIVTSPFHRFWKASVGWVMARDLQAGDRLRLLNGTVVVAESQVGAMQQVYNLDVAEDADFFAGSSAVLVHDITLLNPRVVPFDKPQGEGKANPTR